MFCKNCGSQINDDADFCQNCGSKNESKGNNDTKKISKNKKIDKEEMIVILITISIIGLVIVGGIIGLIKYNNSYHAKYMAYIQNPFDNPKPDKREWEFKKIKETNLFYGYIDPNDSSTLIITSSQTDNSKKIEITNESYYDGVTFDTVKWQWDKFFDESGNKDQNKISQNKKNIKKIIIKDLIKPISASYMFCGFENLMLIDDLKQVGFSNVTDFSYMFSGCKNLEKIHLPSLLPPKNPINMNYMFKNCLNAQEINFENWKMSKDTSCKRIFENFQTVSSHTFYNSGDFLNGKELTIEDYCPASGKFFNDMKKEMKKYSRTVKIQVTGNEISISYKIKSGYKESVSQEEKKRNYYNNALLLKESLDIRGIVKINLHSESDSKTMDFSVETDDLVPDETYLETHGCDKSQKFIW